MSYACAFRMSLNMEERRHQCPQGSQCINRIPRLQCTTLTLVRPYPLMHLEQLWQDRGYVLDNLINNQRTQCSQMHSLVLFDAAFSHIIWHRGAFLHVISCLQEMEPGIVTWLILMARTGTQILPTPVIAWICIQIVLVMIFHTDAVIVRTRNKKEVIYEICGHKCVVKNVKFIVDKLQFICVALSSSLKAWTSAYMLNR